MSFDLLSLIPSKFHSEVLTTFVDIVSEADNTSLTVLSIREILDKIAYTEHLLDPYRAPGDPDKSPGDYLQYLADLIGATLARDDVATEAERRKELLRMIDWYKVKGTYLSIAIISLITGLTIEVYDKYTNNYDDYSAFVDEDWFVGDEGENPVGLGKYVEHGDYYKTPHFGVSFLLNKVYDAGSQYDEGGLDRHLWRPSLFTGLSDYIEKTRPVNTVPHYQILSRHVAYEDKGICEIEDSEVATQIVSDLWTYSKLFFDGAGDEQVYFDDGEVDSEGRRTTRFDSSFETFINSINGWKLGTGGRDLTPPGFGDYNIGPVPADCFGTLTDTHIYADRIEFKFSVAAVVTQNGINELGLYKNEELIIMSTFPDIHKGAGTRLDFLVIIYRE